MRRNLFIIFLLLALGAPPRASRGFEPAYIDTGVNPCADFFQYAVGTWEKRTTIPPEYAKYGVDQEVEARTFAILKDILEGAARDTSALQGSERQKVGDFFAAGMDETRIEEEGARPLDPFLTRIAAVHNREALATEIAFLQEIGAGVAFRLEVGPDDRNSARNILEISQHGLGLPDRDYYLKQDVESKRLRQEYGAHAERMFRLLGDEASTAKKNAQTVMRLETRLARASMTRAQTDDPIATYHKMSRSALAKHAAGFAWDAYFHALGLDGVKTLLVRQPLFFRDVGRMARGVPPADWRTYLRWHLLRATAGYLSAPFVREAFAFNGTTLEGIQAPPPRWRRVLVETDVALGEALGKLYVERAFSPQAKEKALELVANLRAALRARIQRLDWMGGATKMHALAKLDAMRVKIGYPDVWRDYAALEVSRTSYLGNVLAARRFEFRRNVTKVGKAVDHTEWSITPITNNAYYEPTQNELVFPAGILQPPFFDPEADDALNYGNIGATIGHEMSHGFDDGGRKYDARGNLRNWWTTADATAYRQRTALLVKQFDAFEPTPGMHVNGRLTLGENLADLAGLIVAYDAFKRTQEDRAAVSQDGFTPEQRFFLSYAETWRFKLREEALRARLLTDEHAPPRYRVLGPLANLPDFAAAFGCKAGDAMVRRAKERPNNWQSDIAR
ncbi:MAG TPA: M13 family metallopeptidase [Candidatus Methylomirabilis sp.]|nr:M13 family metallopeptidase [Candidatus Methylomirabilis sp.]